MLKKARAIWPKIPLEAALWILALTALAFINPLSSSHFTLCPIGNLGFESCPGCGLGRSISLAFKGQVMASLQMHPLGLFTIIILSYRSIGLIGQSIKNKT